MEEVEEVELDVLMIQINCSAVGVILVDPSVLSPGVTDTYQLASLVVPHKFLSLTTQTLVNEAVMVSKHSLRFDWLYIVMHWSLIVESLSESNEVCSGRRETVGHVEGA